MTKHKCVALVTDDRKHDAGAILAFMHELARLVKETLPQVKTIHYASDSPSSQYRNITILSILCKHRHIFGLNATWCYFEAGHGKGPCDGVGAAAKRMATNTVKRRGLIRNATDFVAKGNAAPGEVLYVNVTPQEIKRRRGNLKKITASRHVKGTLSVHAVVSVQEGRSIAVRGTSCYGPCCWDRGTSLRQCEGWEVKTLFPEVEPEEAPEPQPEEAPEAPEPQREDAPEPQPEVAPPSQPEEAPEPQPEEAPEPQREDAPEPQREDAPEPQPEVAPPSQPEEAPEPQPEEAPEPQREDAPEPQREDAPEPQPEVAPPSQPEEAPEPQPEEALEPQREDAPEPQPEVAPPSQPEEAPEPQPEEAPEPQREDAPEPQPEDAPEPQPEEAPEPQPEEAPEPQREEAPEPQRKDAPEPQREDAPEPQPEEAPEPQPEEAPEPEMRRLLRTKLSTSPRIKSTTCTGQVTSLLLRLR